MLYVVQTAHVFAAIPPGPTDAERRDLDVPTKSRAARRELSGQMVWPVDPGRDTLQTAYNEASAGDVLELGAGNYTGSGDNVLRIARDVTIRVVPTVRFAAAIELGGGRLHSAVAARRIAQRVGGRRVAPSRCRRFVRSSASSARSSSLPPSAISLRSGLLICSRLIDSPAQLYVRAPRTGGDGRARRRESAAGAPHRRRHCLAGEAGDI